MFSGSTASIQPALAQSARGSVLTRQIDQTSKAPAVVDLPALESASRVLQEQFAKDAQTVPDLGETLTSSGSQSSASYSVFPDDYKTPFQRRKFKNIPDDLFHYFTNANVTTHIGLMPEIERAWITVDNKLFLWDYVEGQDISSFVDQPYMITNVALVKPRPGVFVDEITFILVICTPMSILLLGVSSNPVNGPNNHVHKDIKLYATDMSVKSNVEMTHVVGTLDGRIFMAGSQDGSVYEFYYQEKEGWFESKTKLVNISIGSYGSTIIPFAHSRSDDRIEYMVSDTSRGCFYVLTAKAAIQVWKPTGPQVAQHVHTISNLYKAAQDKAPGSPALTPQNFQILSLHVIEPSESRAGVQLMAITTNAVRLYFGPSASYGYSFTGSSSSTRPLALTHVRLPPPNLLHPDVQMHNVPAAAFGNAQNSVVPAQRPYVIAGLEHCCYYEGLLVAAKEGEAPSTGFLLCLSPDLTRIGVLGQTVAPQPQQPPSYGQGAYGGGSGSSRPPLTEQALVLPVMGRAFAMAPAPRPPRATPPSVPAPTTLNELALQFTETAHWFMVLTNEGLSWVVKRRCLDYLRDAIEEAQNGNAQSIIEFNNNFGRDQTCAMLLGLASGNTFLEPDILLSAPGPITAVPPEVAAIAKQAFYDIGGRPMWAERITYGTSDVSGTAIFSGRREGFALYFSRLVRPMWKSKLTATAGTVQKSNIVDSLLVTVQRNLIALKEFLDKNPQLFHSSIADQGAARAPAGTEQEAWKAEQRSVAQLQDLLTRTIEAISFVLLLHDHRFEELILHCEANVQKLLSGLIFEELVTTLNGMTVSRALVNVVIDQQIGQQISVDTISEVLQQRCGSFCSTDDVMLYKAKENVRKAVETRHPMDRQNLLNESLRLFTKGARIMDFDKIREACGDYQQLNYAKGAVELPLGCAAILDPDNIGAEYWLQGCPPNDPRAQFLERRIRCYDLVLDSLAKFEDNCAKATASSTKDDPETVRSHAFELSFISTDELFHSHLYDWLLEKGLADELLNIRPPFLEAHLRRDPPTVEKYSLLWQFYIKEGASLRAAEVLAALAESTQFDIRLDNRLEYLTRAVGNAKSHPLDPRGRHESAIEFLTDLEEKLEVAQVQLEIHNTLLPLTGSMDAAAQAKVSLLSKQLLSISELYEEYADPFDLPTMKLLIIHVSEHRDAVLVQNIWDQIFEEVKAGGGDPPVVADNIIAKVVPLGLRFHASDSAFPFRHIASLLVRFELSNKTSLPFGWAPRVLIQCGVSYSDVWDALHEMYESQVPPFNEQRNVQTLASDIAVLLSDWLQEAMRPHSSVWRGDFPVGRIDEAVNQYLQEVDPSRTETKATFETVKRTLRRNW